MDSKTPFEHAVIGPVEKSDEVPPGFWSRVQAAQRLGVSVAEIRRRERAGKLKGEYYGPRRIVIFPQADVDAQKPNRITKKHTPVLLQKEANGELREPPPSPYTAKEATAVMASLREGKSLLDCVIDHMVHPNAVKSIAAEYARMQGGLFLSGEMLQAINRLPLDGPMPITKGEELLAVLTIYAENVCCECRKRPGVVCKHCVTAAFRKFAEKAREAKDPDAAL